MTHPSSTETKKWTNLSTPFPLQAKSPHHVSGLTIFSSTGLKSDGVQRGEILASLGEYDLLWFLRLTGC